MILIRTKRELGNICRSYNLMKVDNSWHRHWKGELNDRTIGYYMGEEVVVCSSVFNNCSCDLCKIRFECFTTKWESY